MPVADFERSWVLASVLDAAGIPPVLTVVALVFVDVNPIWPPLLALHETSSLGGVLCQSLDTLKRRS